VFYPGDYRVTIFYGGIKESIMTSMPEYFKTDKSNCGDQLIWNSDKINTFLADLASHQGRGEGQSWYDNFSQIVKTLIIN
jgi:hypothetical protein